MKGSRMALFDHLKVMLGSGRVDVSKRFTFLHRAITGTMSKFYVARDMQTSAVVGVKILDPVKSAAFESRFKGLHKPCEGEIAAQFDHPHIVRTFEYGLTTEGAPYLVMEHLAGPNMSAMLASHAFCMEGHRVHFIREAAQAIAAVHEAGFIHRNVCSRHFLLTNERRDLKLIDFGLSVPATKWFMRPGNRTGTPDYMAPELVHRRPTDQRLDVFAFGVTAYELCASALPWQHGVAMAHDQPPADIRRYCPNIHPVLAKAIHACIEPEVTQRCSSMEAFLRMIREVPADGGLG
jgi:eukaryotic-like serine/threonine-protein kinase